MRRVGHFGGVGRQTSSAYNGVQRATDGVIVTGYKAGRLVVVHRPGPMRESLPEAVVGLERVLSISTPSSVLRDLQGTRADLRSPDGDNRGGGSAATPVLVEPLLLGKIGRRDLWQGP